MLGWIQYNRKNAGQKPEIYEDILKKSSAEPITTIDQLESTKNEVSQPVILKKTSYFPSGLHSNKIANYPIVIYPTINTIIKFPRVGRSGNKGYTEDHFCAFLNQYFDIAFIIYTKHHLTQKGHARPYEPDFVLANEKEGKNIFINIEIDEPYDGVSRFPTHIINQDTYRNNYFVNRGYIVIRFSEIQIHKSPLGCCKIIAEVINSIDPRFMMSSELNNSVLYLSEQWDSLQSKKWSNENYREQYLGIVSFGIKEQTDVEYEIVYNEEDLEVEKNVVESIPFIGTSYNPDLLERDNSNLRDRRITFDALNHKYYIDNNPDTISVSQLVDKFFPEFDSFRAASKLNPNHQYYGLDPVSIVALWKQNGLEKAHQGTFLHEQIENFYNRKPYDDSSIEFKYFLRFKSDFKNMIPFRTEWRIFDEELLIAGTIDKIYKRDENSFYMFDWKRSEKVVKPDGKILLSDPNGMFTEFASGELNHLTNDSYYKYCLQQNLYRHILERRYSFKISSMNLLILHPALDTYKWVKIPVMNKEIEYILRISKIRF